MVHIYHTHTACGRSTHAHPRGAAPTGLSTKVNKNDVSVRPSVRLSRFNFMLHQIADAELHHTGLAFFRNRGSIWEYLSIVVLFANHYDARLAKGRRRRLERPGATYGTYLPYPYRLRPVHARTPARRSPHRLVK